MPLLEAFYLNWSKRRASMSVSELLATLRMLSSSVQAALTLKSLTSTRAISSIMREEYHPTHGLQKCFKDLVTLPESNTEYGRA